MHIPGEAARERAAAPSSPGPSRAFAKKMKTSNAQRRPCAAPSCRRSAFRSRFRVRQNINVMSSLTQTAFKQAFRRASEMLRGCGRLRRRSPLGCSIFSSPSPAAFIIRKCIFMHFHVRSEILPLSAEITNKASRGARESDREDRCSSERSQSSPIADGHISLRLNNHTCCTEIYNLFA